MRVESALAFVGDVARVDIDIGSADNTGSAGEEDRCVSLSQLGGEVDWKDQAQDPEAGPFGLDGGS